MPDVWKLVEIGKFQADYYRNAVRMMQGDMECAVTSHVALG